MASVSAGFLFIGQRAGTGTVAIQDVPPCNNKLPAIRDMFRYPNSVPANGPTCPCILSMNIQAPRLQSGLARIGLRCAHKDGSLAKPAWP